MVDSRGIMYRVRVPRVRVSIVVACVTASLGGALALAGSGGQPTPVAAEAQGRTPPPGEAGVRESRREAQTASPVEGFVGVILARSAAEIAPRFEGKIRHIHVRLGDHVPAGALIAELDVPSLVHDLHVAEAELKAAQVERARVAVEVAEAKERLSRRLALAADSLVSKEDVIGARYQAQLAEKRLDAATASVEQRRAAADRLRKDNADTRITAPFEGVVAARYVDVGATVRPSAPLIRLISGGELFVRFAVPEQQVGALGVGRPVRVHLDTPRADLRATVDKVSPEIDAAAHLVFLEAKLDPVPPRVPLLSGLMARVFAAETP